MKECGSGRVIKVKKKDKQMYYIRLNFVETLSDGMKRYSTKDLPTGLEATKRNWPKANAMLDDAITSSSSDYNRMFYHDYLDRWLEGKKPTLELTTYEGYQYRANSIREYFKAHPVLLTELKPADIHDFYSSLLTKEHFKGKQRIIGYSNRSIKDIALILKASLAEAVDMEILKRSPAARVKIPKKPEEKKLRPYVGSDQCSDFLEAIRGHRLELPFTFAIYYGMRRSEILGLRWSAIRDGKIYVEHTISKMKTTQAKDRAKTEAGYRSYPLTPEIESQLAQIKAAQDVNRALFGSDYQESDYVFTWEDGHPYSTDYITKEFKKVVRASEHLSSDLTLHSLRASCISILVHKGVDIKDIQTWVGHRDIQTTMNIYASTTEKEQAEVAKRMSETFFRDQPA